MPRTARTAEERRELSDARRLSGPAPRRDRRFGWPALCITALVIATAYALRLRTADRAVEGDIDLQIVLEVLVYGAVGTFLATRIRLSRRGRPRPLAVIAWVYSSVVALSVVYSPIPTFAVVRIGQLGVGLLVVVAIENAASRHQLHRMLHAFVGLVLLTALSGFAVPFTYPSQVGRYTWWNTHPNQAALLLAITAIILVAYTFDPRHRPHLMAPRGAYGLVLVFIVVALLATQSRTAIAGTVAGAFFAVMHTARRRNDVAVIGAISLAIAALLWSSSVQTFLLRGQDPEEFGTLSTRTSVWDFAIEKIGESPAVGHGYGAARSLFSYTFSEIGGAHNAFVELALDAGLIGGTLLALLTTCTLVFAWRTARKSTGGYSADGPILLGVVVLLIINSLTAQGLGQPATIQTLWLFIVIGWLLKAGEAGARTR